MTDSQGLPSEATTSKASNQQGFPTAYTTPWYTTSYAQSASSTTGLYQPQTGNPYAAYYGPQAYYPQYQALPTTFISQPPSNLKLTPKSPSPSPPPSPPLPDPETYKHWDVVIRAFFLKTGLTQALKGFEDDMLVFNPEWEQLKIPVALEELIKGLTALLERRPPQAGEGQTGDAMQVDVPLQPADSTPLQPKSKSKTITESLEARKLAYVHLENDAQPRSQSSINNSISLFLAKNQARNDASNRAEFLSSLAERRKRQRAEEGDSHPPIDSSDVECQKTRTCARADAKPIDRDTQMKYDIAKDDWGPLSRSAKAGLLSEVPLEAEVKPIKKEIDEEFTSARHPGLDERLKNIEDHIAVRFVPNPPRTLLARLQFLEDHLVKLEKEYPPWAALHFNQPARGWPPPPRTTPIIVPLHLRDTRIDATSADPPAAKSKSKNKKARSSLQRAVMERLEVQKARAEPGCLM